MLATLTDAPFDDPDWVFESKWDGFRVVASIEGGNQIIFLRETIGAKDNVLRRSQASPPWLWWMPF